MLRKLVHGLPAGVFILGGLALVNALSTSSASFIALYLSGNRGLDMETVGTILSCRGLALIAGGYAVGAIMDRFGVRSTLIANLLIAGCAFFLLPLASTAVLFGISLVVIAFTRAAFRPAYNVHLVSVCGERERGRAYSIFVMATNGGIGTAAIIGGLMMTKLPPAMFLVDGALCLITALAAFHILRPSYGLSDKKKIGKAISARRPWRDRHLLVICLVYLLVELVDIQIYFTVPIYLAEYKDIAVLTWGYMMTGLSLCIFLLSLPATTFAKRFDARLVIMCAAAAMCFGIAGMWLCTNLIQIGACWLSFSLGQVFLYPALMQRVLTITTPDSTARYVAFYYSWSSVAALIGPVAGGWLYKHWSPGAIFLVAAVIGVICISICLKWKLSREDLVEGRLESGS